MSVRYILVVIVIVIITSKGGTDYDNNIMEGKDTIRKYDELV